MAKRAVLVGVIVVAAVAALGVGRAQAGLFGCRYPALSQPFAQWGDSTSYYLDPGGSFEGWTTPWLLGGGARLSPGNESFHVNGSSDSQSLLLPAGASALGPASCITGTDLKVRMFARSDDGAPVRVDVMVPAVLGSLRVATTFYVDTSSDWQPTSTIVNLANVLSLTDLSSTNLYLRLSAPSGSVQVDDVYVDPKCWI